MAKPKVSGMPFAVVARVLTSKSLAKMIDTAKTVGEKVEAMFASISDKHAKNAAIGKVAVALLSCNAYKIGDHNPYATLKVSLPVGKPVTTSARDKMISEGDAESLKDFERAANGKDGKPRWQRVKVADSMTAVVRAFMSRSNKAPEARDVTATVMTVRRIAGAYSKASGVKIARKVTKDKPDARGTKTTKFDIVLPSENGASRKRFDLTDVEHATAWVERFGIDSVPKAIAALNSAVIAMRDKARADKAGKEKAA